MSELPEYVLDRVFDAPVKWFGALGPILNFCTVGMAPAQKRSSTSLI